MSTGSTLVVVKDALLVGLRARPGLAGVQVAYALPQRGLQREAIWFGEETETDAAIPVMRAGIKKVEEQYSLPMVLQVLVTDGRDERAADGRAVELLAELQQLLAERPRITDAIEWAELSAWAHYVGPIGDSTNRGARFEVQITVRARLFP